MTAVKRCPRCGQVKAAEAFYRRRGRRLSSYCQPCTRAASHEAGDAAGARTRPRRRRCGWWIGSASAATGPWAAREVRAGDRRTRARARAGDRSPAAGLRAELQVASVASGLLLLLDAHRLTGRLPLEIQVQVGRLRHAVKVAIQAQAEAARRPGATAPAQRGPGRSPAGLDRRPALGPARPPGLGVPAVLPRPDHRPAPAPAGPGLSGPVRRPLLGLDPGPDPPHHASTATPPGPAPAASSRSPSRPGCRSSWPGWSIRPPGAGSGGSRTRARPTGAARCAGAPAAPWTRPPPSPPSTTSSEGGRDRPAGAGPSRPRWWVGGAGGGHGPGRAGRPPAGSAAAAGRPAPPGRPARLAPPSHAAQRRRWWGVPGQGTGADRPGLGRPPRRRPPPPPGHRPARPRRHPPGRGDQRHHHPPQQPRSGSGRDQPVAARCPRHRATTTPTTSTTWSASASGSGPGSCWPGSAPPATPAVAHPISTSRSTPAVADRSAPTRSVRRWCR